MNEFQPTEKPARDKYVVDLRFETKNGTEVLRRVVIDGSNPDDVAHYVTRGLDDPAFHNHNILRIFRKK